MFQRLDVVLSVLASPVRKGRGTEELGCLIDEDGFLQLPPVVLMRCTFMIFREVTWLNGFNFCNFAEAFFSAIFTWQSFRSID